MLGGLLDELSGVFTSFNERLAQENGNLRLTILFGSSYDGETRISELTTKMLNHIANHLCIGFTGEAHEFHILEIFGLGNDGIAILQHFLLHVLLNLLLQTSVFIDGFADSS